MKATDTENIGVNGLEITRLGIGGTALGNMYSASSSKDAKLLIDAAITRGIRYFDTAPLYGFGLSETRLGEGLESHDRNSFAISSKVGYTLVPESEGEVKETPFVDVPPLTTIFDFSRDGTLRSIDSSLSRLKTDRLDIVLIHDPDESKSIESGWSPGDAGFYKEVMNGAYPTLEKLRDDGVVKAIGLGMNQWQMLSDFARDGDFDCFLLAGRYTLLEQESLKELLPLCQERGIKIIIGGPYNSGILATGPINGAMYNYGPAPESVRKHVFQIELVCKRHNVPLRSAALQFPFGHPSVASIVPGARSVKEVNDNIQLMDYEIPSEFWSELKAEKLLSSEVPTL
tara:strand:- start:56 stop:1084 length:1029 start_codon:yes stop_codon:yes gene_type:complete